MPAFRKISTARLISASVSTLALSAALLADVQSTVAADFHFVSSNNVTWGQAGGSGFEGPNPLPGIGDRAIYDKAGTGQSVMWGAPRAVGQLVFLAPYTGSGFVPMTPASQSSTLTLHGVDGLGVDSRVNQQITLSERIALGGNQEWRIDSDTGSITQLGHTPFRFLFLGSSMLTLNAVGTGNSFRLNNGITGAGGLIVKGAGTTYLSGPNSSYSGGTFLDGGTVEVAADRYLGAASGGLSFDGGTLRFGSSFTSARTISLTAGGGTIDTKGNTATLSGNIAGSGGLTVAGGGVLNLTGAIAYAGATIIRSGTLALSGNASLASSSGVVADGVLDISATTSGASVARLSGSGAVNFGSQALTLAQANDTFSGVFTGSGNFILAGGQQTLTGNSSAFTGTTTVNAGILTVNGTLGGTMDVLGGRLQGIGSVGTTINHLGGIIAPGNSIGTLTVAGNYTSNGGALEVEAELGDSSSPADLLVITGDSILGTGPTQVRVINVGGAGAETTGDGVRIVQVDGTSAADAFLLNGPAIAGAYSYKLFQNGISDPADGDWYLRAAGLAPTTPVYQNYPQVLLGMVALPTLDQRVGDRRRVAAEGNAGAVSAPAAAIWTRIEAAHGHVVTDAGAASASYDANTALTQIGFDGQFYEGAAGMLIGGLTVQYSRASADIFSSLGDGANTTTSYGIGANLTWHGASGFYVDAQAQVATLRSDMSAAGIGEIGDGIHGNGYALSLEAGHKIALDSTWSLTPQAQLAYSSVSFDAFTDPFGANVSLKKGDSLKGRIGAALNYDAAASGSHVYGIGNLTYEFLDGASVAVSGVDLAFEPQRFGGEIGVGGSYKWAGGKYALHGEALASTSFQGGYGFKGVIGFTAGL